MQTDHPASEVDKNESELPAVESPRSEINSEVAKQFGEMDIGDYNHIQEGTAGNQVSNQDVLSSQKSYLPNTQTPL